MKNTLLLVSMLFVITICNSQKIKAIDSLKITDIKQFNAKPYKSKVSVKTLILKNGTILNKGTELLLGRPSNTDDKSIENTAVNFTQVFFQWQDSLKFLKKHEDSACD